MPKTVQIEVEQDIFERLQALAKPFVDTPSSVIRRLLEANNATENQQDIARVGAPSQAPNKQGYVTSRGVRLPLGRLQASYRRRGSTSTQRFEAEVTPKGIEFDGEVFDDPSPAGIRAKELAGAKGAATSTNGWEFWQYFDEVRQEWVSIDIFRKKSIPKISLDDLDLDI